jgi:ubiquinol oxidase
LLSDTHYLAQIDGSRAANLPATGIARHCGNRPAGATLRDVVCVVHADGAHHRDVNHGFANRLAATP